MTLRMDGLALLIPACLSGKPSMSKVELVKLEILSMKQAGSKVQDLSYYSPNSLFILKNRTRNF